MNKLDLATIIKIAIPGLIVFVLIMFMSGSFNPYKRAYKKELENQRLESEAREDSLKNYVFSLENEAIKLQNKADSTLKALELEELTRKKEKDEFNKKMAQLSKLSTTELASYFAKRYNN
jgi:hypothetical protein